MLALFGFQELAIVKKTEIGDVRIHWIYPAVLILMDAFSDKGCEKIHDLGSFKIFPCKGSMKYRMHSISSRREVCDFPIAKNFAK